MQLLDHVSITVRELRRARAFYLAVMETLDAQVAYDREDAIGFGERNRPHDDVHTYVSIYESPAAQPDPRRHYCLRAGSISQVNAFHAAGVAAGGTSDGPPGLRKYHSGYYAAFLLDPEGNKIEAVFHHAESEA
jgi:catechol 2,3-dioxygenase-like lactoylglutathione lyase family enzyme